MRRIPVVATLVVLVAAGLMVALGVWQLHRMHEKEALLARYAGAHTITQEIAWTGTGPGENMLYRRAALTCAKATMRSSIAGRNAAGTPGVAQTVRCILPDGGTALVVLGWSVQPNAGGEWQGGKVRGIVAPGPRLVADPPLAGLQSNAQPDPADIPNNHFSYAIQWFFFAATALAVYVVALSKRQRPD